MPSPTQEVIFALRTQGISQKAIAAQVACSQSTISRILHKDLSAPVNSGGRPKKTSPQDDRALKTIALSNRFESTASITHLCNETMTSPVSRSTTYRWWLRYQGFSSRIPCTKPLLSLKQKKNVYSSHTSTLSGQLKIGKKSSSRMSQNLSWAMATSGLAFSGKMKGTRRRVWSAMVSVQPS